MGLEPPSAEISSDGNHLAFADESDASAIHLVDLATGEVRVVAADDLAVPQAGFLA